MSRLCHAMVLAVWVSSHFSGGTYSDVITPSSFKRAWGEGQPHDTACEEGVRGVLGLEWGSTLATFKKGKESDF